MRLVPSLICLSFFCISCSDGVKYTALKDNTEENFVDVEQLSVIDDSETIGISDCDCDKDDTTNVASTPQEPIIIDDSVDLQEENIVVINSEISKRIFQSIYACDKDEFALVLEHVPSSGLVDKSANTPLIRSIRHGCLDLMRLLIAHGVDVNEPDGEGYSPLHWAAIKNNSSATRELLSIPEVNTNARDTDSGRTPLLWAIFSLSSPNNHINLENLILLINSPRVDINATDSVSNASAVIYVAKLSDDEVMTLNRKNLMEAILSSPEVNVFHEDKHGLDALTWAELSYNVQVVELLEDRIYQTIFGR